MKLSLAFYVLMLFTSCGSNTTKENKNDLEANTTIKKAEVLDTAAKDLPKNVQDNASVIKEEKKDAPDTSIEIQDLEKTKNTTKVAQDNSPISKKPVPLPKDTISKKDVEDANVQTNPINKEDVKKQEKDGERIATSNKENLSVNEPEPHQSWDKLLKKYVDSKGNVDYKSFKGSKAALEAYLDALAKNLPTTTWSKKERLAYYINLYNAATVKLILDNYPTKSIKDIRSPWDKKIVKIGDKLFSLGHIEHKILRKMDEPRIHFAINCASYSCPKLINTAFTAKKMEQQLKKATKDFVNDPTRNQFKDGEARLSKIFKWYKGDFTDNGSLIDYINPYLSNPLKKNTKIKYLDYDWNLNE